MDQIGILTHCQIFDKSLSNAMDMPENFYRNSIILAEINKHLDCLGHISIKQIFYKILNLLKKSQGGAVNHKDRKQMQK